VLARRLNVIRHPSGVRVIRRETAHELGPSDDETELLALLAAAITAGTISDIESVVFEWRDDGCHLAVRCQSFVLLREIGTRGRPSTAC
jgi:hypothetical protein